MKHIHSVRGMHDMLPDVGKCWFELECILRNIVTKYGYQEIKLPLLEYTEVFTNAIGESTDIIEKEMYSFLDRSGKSLTLRPEGTAGCVRAGIEYGILHNSIKRFFYYGPMFRHDRPQKGRYRQLHQFGVEVFGLSGPIIDLELILLVRNIWKIFNIEDKIELHINTLGNKVVRSKFREKLVQYFEDNLRFLDIDCQRRLKNNPLRILDSKNPNIKNLIENAPSIIDYLDAKSEKHFFRLCELLNKLDIKYKINPTLVRGLDYYNLTVFEWLSKDINNVQNAVCAGGRYGELVGRMGGKSTPAAGFALGMDRLFNIIKDTINPPIRNIIYLLHSSETEIIVKIMKIADDIRNCCKYDVIVHGDEFLNINNHLKKAYKNNAKIVAILDEDTFIQGRILIKCLSNNSDQYINITEIVNFVNNYIDVE